MYWRVFNKNKNNIKFRKVVNYSFSEKIQKIFMKLM